MPAERSVMMVSFDVPFETKQERRAYRSFHKYLKRSGYILLQKSLYVKLISASSGTSELRELRKYAPENGNVLALLLTANMFQRMTLITGSGFDFESFSEEILCF